MAEAKFVKEWGSRLAAGDLSVLIDPLDYKILELLQPEGANMGGLYNLGTTVKEVSRKFGVPSALLSPRFRLLRMGGLAIDINMIGSRGARGWQRTTKGDEVLKAWQQTQS